MAVRSLLVMDDMLQQEYAYRNRLEARDFVVEQEAKINPKGKVLICRNL